VGNNSENIEEATVPHDPVPGVEYAGFWIRLLASILDSILLLMVSVPLLLWFYGPEVFFVTESPGLAYDIINIVLPIIAFLVFWQYRAATPGKIMVGIYIVDAETLGKPPFDRLILRYIGYYVSLLPLCLGFLWIGFDKRKQGFHDKIARTLVIRKEAGKAAPETADNTETGKPDAWTA